MKTRRAERILERLPDIESNAELDLIVESNEKIPASKIYRRYNLYRVAFEDTIKFKRNVDDSQIVQIVKDLEKLGARMTSESNRVLTFMILLDSRGIVDRIHRYYRYSLGQRIVNVESKWRI